MKIAGSRQSRETTAGRARRYKKNNGPAANRHIPASCATPRTEATEWQCVPVHLCRGEALANVTDARSSLDARRVAAK